MRFSRLIDLMLVDPKRSPKDMLMATSDFIVDIGSISKRLLRPEFINCFRLGRHPSHYHYETHFGLAEAGNGLSWLNAY